MKDKELLKIPKQVHAPRAVLRARIHAFKDTITLEDTFTLKYTITLETAAPTPTTLPPPPTPLQPASMFFSANSALGPPYHILLDTNFINFRRVFARARTRATALTFAAASRTNWM